MKRHLLILTVLLALFSGQTFSQSNYICGTPPSPAAPFSVSRAENCENSGTAYMTKYRTPKYWIPTTVTPIKTILVNYIICQDENNANAWQDCPALRANINRMFAEVNKRYSQVQPQGEYKVACKPIINYITDTRIRFELNEIIFIKDSVDRHFNKVCDFYDGQVIDEYVYKTYPKTRNGMNHIFTMPDKAANDKCGYYMGFYWSYRSENSPPTDDRAFVLTRSVMGNSDVVFDDFVNHSTHEYGHALGLFHTYDGEETQISDFDFLDDVYGTCTEPSMSDNSLPCVKDKCTPQTDYVCYLKTCSFVDKFGTPLLGNPLMSGAPNNTYISPKSAGRMHRALSLIKNTFLGINNNPMHQYVKEQTSYPVPLTLTTSETWDFSIQLYQDIVVKSGATLTISCEVRMPINGKITVESGGQLIVDGGKITSAWDELWLGITLNPGSKLLVKNVSTIENAATAIWSVGGAPFIVENSTLNKNYTGIYMGPFAGTHPGVIKKSKISCVDADNNPAPLLPCGIVGSRAITGITLDNVTMATIGVAAAGQTNIFDNVEIGIANNSSNLTVINNSFTRINNNTNNQRGRCISSINDTTVEKSLRVGGSNYEKNVFTNSSVGVYVSKNQDVTVGYNSFNTISGSAAIYMYNCATEGNAISITSNSIDNCYTAIYSLGGAGSSTIDIANNKINQNVKTINSKASKGITISNTTLNPIATLPIVTIVANHIKRVSTGIEVTNYRTPSIRLNQLSELSNLTATTPSNGLLFTACPSITVEGNTVTGVGAELWWMNGIRIEPGCSNGLLLSNTVADIGRGILFLGTNLSAKMIKNTLKNNTDGLVLGSSIIGYQLGDGTSCKAQENKWQGTFSQSNILSINSNGEQSPFNFLAQTNPSWVPEMKTPATIVSIAQGGGTPVPAFSCNNNSGYREIDDETGPIQTDLLNKLAKDEISFPLYNASTKWWVKYNLYDMLQTDVKLQDNPQLKAFAKTNAVGNIGELYQLNQSLNNHIAIDTEVIRVAGRGFTPQNKLEKNLQVVYDIIVANRTSQTLNDVEIQQLQTIAKLCPYESGPAVFNARVLLSSIENTTYSNPCESIPFGEVVTNTEQDLENTMSDPTKSVVVFPNPATDKLTLVNHLNAGESGLFSLYDLTGKLIFSQVLFESNNATEMSISHLSKGLYVYKFSVNNILKTSGKISIVR